MTREELEKSPEYEFTKLQMEIFRIISEYKKENHLGRKDLSIMLGVSERNINLILNGDCDLRLSELFQIMSKIRHKIMIKLVRE